MTPTFSICHTTARPNGWQESYEEWVTKASNPNSVEYVLCVDARWGFEKKNFVEHISSLPDCYGDVVWNTKRKCSVDGWNIAAAASTGKVIILNSDMFPPDRWDEELLEAISKNSRAFRDSQLC